MVVVLWVGLLYFNIILFCSSYYDIFYSESWTECITLLDKLRIIDILLPSWINNRLWSNNPCYHLHIMSSSIIKVLTKRNKAKSCIMIVSCWELKSSPPIRFEDGIYLVFIVILNSPNILTRELFQRGINRQKIFHSCVSQTRLPAFQVML